MTKEVLILGGRGRIGASVAQDLGQYTAAKITVTGRGTPPDFLPENLEFLRQREFTPWSGCFLLNCF